MCSACPIKPQDLKPVVDLIKIAWKPPPPKKSLSDYYHMHYSEETKHKCFMFWASCKELISLKMWTTTCFLGGSAQKM